MNARRYSEVSDVQLQYGKSLALLAGIKRRDKVLDMGCGTGELTSFLAEQVDKGSQVVGVDPDLERIKIAIQKHIGIHGNIIFEQGESSSQFPHFDEQYYDIHFSNFVFQWLNCEEKENFAQTAFNCLKPGGNIAIQSQEDDADVVKEAAKLFLCDTENVKSKVPVYYVKKSVTENLLHKVGFVIVYSEYYKRSYTFPSAQCFLSCFCASDYYDESIISPIKKTELFNKIVNSDGTVTFFAPTVYQVIATKPDSK
jgi:ubiquinone/menaquinone biosynthesis C-methylase UbiE